MTFTLWKPTPKFWKNNRCHGLFEAYYYIQRIFDYNKLFWRHDAESAKRNTDTWGRISKEKKGPKINGQYSFSNAKHACFISLYMHFMIPAFHFRIYTISCIIMYIWYVITVEFFKKKILWNRNWFFKKHFKINSLLIFLDIYACRNIWRFIMRPLPIPHWNNV